MRKYLLTIIAVLILSSGIAFAQSVPTVSQWFLNVAGNYLYPIKTNAGIKVPSLANQNCIGTDSTGLFGAGTCSGGGGSGSTTIAGLTPTNGVFLFGTSTNTTLSTTSPRTITLTSIPPVFATVCPASGNCNYTAATSSNADVGLQAALTAAGNNPGGGTVLVKPGTYNFGSSISIPSGVFLQCDGQNTTFNVTTTTSQSIYFNAVSNAGMTGCKIHDVTTDNIAFGITSYRAVEIHDSHNINFYNNYIDNSSGYGVYITSSLNNSSTFVSILNNYIQANGHQDTIGGGPFVQGNSTTSDVSIIGNQIISKVLNGTVGVNVDANCIDMVAVNHIIFNNNNCYGQVWFGSEKVPNVYSEIVGNVISPALGATSTSADIEIRQSVAGIATLTPTQLLINNNILTGGGIRLEGSPTSSIDSAIVSDNTIKNAVAGSQGANGTPSGYGIYFDYVKNSVINGNNIQSSNATPPSGSIGIKLANTTSNILTSNNLIRNYATAQDYGSVVSNVSQLDKLVSNTATYINTGSLLNIDSAGGLQLTTSGANSAIFQINDAGTGQQAGFKLQDGGANKWEIGKQTDNSFFIYDDAHSRDAIDINTTGDIRFQPTAGIVEIGAPSNPAFLAVQGTAGSATDIFIASSSTNTSILKVKANGQVLVGGISDGCMNITSGVLGSTGSACGSGGGGSGGVSTTSPFTNPFVPYATTTLALTNSPIAINGNNVGIGITVPAYPLHLQATSSGSNTQIFRLQNAATAVDTSLSIDWNISTSDLTTNPTAQIRGVRSGSPGGRLEFYTLNGSGINTRGLYIDQNQRVSASSTLITNATTTGQEFLTAITGKILATDPNGMVIGTTSPIFSLANGTNTTASGNAVNLNASLLGMTLFSGTTVNATSGLFTNATTTNLTFTGLTSSYLAVNSVGMVTTTSTPQLPITLTTTGTSGAATFSANTLNIPQYQAAGTYVTAVTGSGSVASSGGVTPNITLQTMAVNDILFGQGSGIIATSSNLTFTASNTLNVTGTSTVSNAMLIGAGTKFAGAFINGQTLLAASTTFAGYVEINLQNQSASTTASSSYVLTANNGTATTNYVDLFQNSSAFTRTSPISGAALDAGLISSDAGLILGTASTTNANANINLVSHNVNIATGTATGFIFNNSTTTGQMGWGTVTYSPPPTQGASSTFLTTNGSGQLTWGTPASAGAGTASGTAGAIQFSNGSSGFNADQSKFFWDNTNKRLGLNTTTPQFGIDVVGGDINLDSSHFMRSNGQIVFGGNGFNTLFRPDSSGGDTQFQSYGGSTNVTFSDSGRISVGTTSVASTLIVQPTGNVSPLTIASSSGVTVLTISTLGQVGIATATPDATLTVYGSNPMGQIFDVTSNLGTILFATATTSTFSYSQTPAGIILDSGVRVGIGTTNTNGYSGGLLDQLTVAGRVNTGDWIYLPLDPGGTVNIAAATDNIYGSNWSWRKDGTNGALLTNNATIHSPFYSLCNDTSNSCNLSTGAANATSGAGVFLFAGNAQGLQSATSTPILDTLARITYRQNATSSAFYIGFENINPAGTTFETEPTSGCYFEASTTLANWQAICRKAGVSTIVDTGFASSTADSNTGKFYRFRLSMDNSGAKFYMSSSTNPLSLITNITTNIASSTNLNVGIYHTRNSAGSGAAQGMDIANTKFWYLSSLLYDY